VISLVEHGGSGGEVLVLGDIGLLGNGSDEPTNLPFWMNLARYAETR